MYILTDEYIVVGLAEQVANIVAQKLSVRLEQDAVALTKKSIR